MQYGPPQPPQMMGPPQPQQSGSPLGDIPPEVLAELLALGGIEGQLGDLAGQEQLAQMLRYRQGPEGRQAGRVYTAANPLEHLAHGIQGYRAGQELKQIPGQREDLRNQQMAGRERFVELLRNR